MLKRIFLFLATNLLILVVISISFTVISLVFGINIGGYYNGSNLLNVFIYALIVGFAGSFISLFLSKFIAKWSYGVQVINGANLSGKEKVVYNLVEKLARDNSIRMPEVGIYNSPEPNAFATGATKNSSLVAVSTGLLNVMNEDEIEGVIAHEMAHVTNGDMVTMVLLQGVINTFVIFLSRIIAYFVENYFRNSDEESSSGSWIYYLVSMILEIIFSILASMLVMWFSRYREYKADEGSAKQVGKTKMILALKKLQKLQDSMLTDDSDKLATMKIGSNKRSGIFSLFASHPDLEDRIKNLESKF